METTLYDDSCFRSLNDNFKPTKRPVTLDLESPATKNKKQRFSAILTSPDVNMLKLASPELERFIIAQAQNGTFTTTPTPTQYLFPKNVTEDQEKYAKGFVDALAMLHEGGTSDSASHFFNQILENTGGSTGFSPIASTGHNYTGLLPANIQMSSVSTAVITSKAKSPTSFVSLSSVVRPPSVESSSSNSYPGTLAISSPGSKSAIKEELQMVPSDNSYMGISPPMSPINLDDQDRIKLERKRYRNRIAASRCRQRKLERISKLEGKVDDLKNENAKYVAIADELRQQVCRLKEEVLDHMKKGCQIMISRVF